MCKTDEAPSVATALTFCRGARENIWRRVSPTRRAADAGQAASRPADMKPASYRCAADLKLSPKTLRAHLTPSVDKVLARPPCLAQKPRAMEVQLERVRRYVGVLRDVACASVVSDAADVAGAADVANSARSGSGRAGSQDANASAGASASTANKKARLG